MKKEKFRITLDLPLEDKNRVEELQQILGITKKAEIFKMALVIYGNLVQQAKDGNQLKVIDESGKEQIVLLPFFPSISTKSAGTNS